MSSLKAFGLLSYLVTKAGLRPRRFKGETAHELVAHCRGLAKRSLVIVDDAHLIPDDSLEDLRLLTGDSLDKKSPFALVLAGQPLLRERLAKPLQAHCSWGVFPSSGSGPAVAAWRTAPSEAAAPASSRRRTRRR